MKSLVFCFILLTFVSESFSQTKTFIREYSYNAGEADSKITSRSLALEQVKKLLLEEIGVYIENTFQNEKTEGKAGIAEVTRDNIVQISAGITQTKIVDEKWDGEHYYIKAQISVDADDIKEKILKISEDRIKLHELEELKKSSNAALQEIEELRKNLAREKDLNKKLSLKNEYDNSVSQLSRFQFPDWYLLNPQSDSLIYYSCSGSSLFEAYMFGAGELTVIINDEIDTYLKDHKDSLNLSESTDLLVVKSFHRMQFGDITISHAAKSFGSENGDSTAFTFETANKLECKKSGSRALEAKYYIELSGTSLSKNFSGNLFTLNDFLKELQKQNPSLNNQFALQYLFNIDRTNLSPEDVITELKDNHLKLEKSASTTDLQKYYILLSFPKPEISRLINLRIAELRSKI